MTDIVECRTLFLVKTIHGWPKRIKINAFGNAITPLFRITDPIGGHGQHIIADDNFMDYQDCPCGRPSTGVNQFRRQQR